MDAEDVPWVRRLAAEPDRDSAVAALGRAFVTATAEERAAVHRGWPFDLAWPYPSVKRLACTIGERASPLDRITSSLVLDWLEGEIGTREHLIGLCAMYRSCELAGLSPVEVFEAVAAVLPAKEAEILRAFTRRDAENRRLSAFALAEHVNADGEIELRLDSSI